MEVIKKGKVEKPVYHAGCGKCNSFLKYDDSDINRERVELFPRLGSPFIVCPVCKNEIIHRPPTRFKPKL